MENLFATRSVQRFFSIEISFLHPLNSDFYICFACFMHRGASPIEDGGNCIIRFRLLLVYNSWLIAYSGKFSHLPTLVHFHLIPVWRKTSPILVDPSRQHTMPRVMKFYCYGCFNRCPGVVCVFSPPLSWWRNKNVKYLKQQEIFVFHEEKKIPRCEVDSNKIAKQQKYFSWMLPLQHHKFFNAAPLIQPLAETGGA